jgi:hypothetical protein
MRWVYLCLLIVLSIIDLLPIPIIGLLLIWVVLFRPLWFYKVVLEVYKNKR